MIKYKFDASKQNVNTMMKLFGWQLCVFITLFVGIIGTGILVTNYLIDKGNYFDLPKDKYYVVLGHSHSECAINDSLVDHCINLSRSGESYLYTYIKMKKIIAENSHIKAFFVEYTNNQVMQLMDEWVYGTKYISYRYAQYSCIMDVDEQMYLLNKNPEAILSKQNKTLLQNLLFLSEAERKPHANYLNKLGSYRYLIRDKTDSLIKAGADTIPVKDADKVSIANLYFLSKIVDLCEKANIKLYLVRSPLNKALKTDGNEKIYKEILQSKFPKTTYWDFKNFELENSDFGDLEHLNYRGAKKFSIAFNRMIKENSN